MSVTLGADFALALSLPGCLKRQSTMKAVRRVADGWMQKVVSQGLVLCMPIDVACEACSLRPLSYLRACIPAYMSLTFAVPVGVRVGVCVCVRARVCVCTSPRAACAFVRNRR